MNHIIFTSLILLFLFISCDRTPIDACYEPDIDTSDWIYYGSDSIVHAWDDHLSLKLPRGYKPRSYTSQHGGFLYRNWFRRFIIEIGMWGVSSFDGSYSEKSPASKCIININDHDVLITTDRFMGRYYVMAWQLGGDSGEYGHTHAYIGISYSRKAQKEFLAVIRTIELREYSVPEYLRSPLPDGTNHRQQPITERK